MSKRLGDACLRSTRELLLEKGWTQGSSRTPDGKMCLSFAMSMTVCRVEARKTAYKRIVSLLPPPQYLAGWNDEQGRTFQEVIDLIDRALEEG